MVSVADPLILFSSRNKYGNSKPESIVRFFQDLPQINKYKLGSLASVSAGLGCTRLGSGGIHLAELGLGVICWAGLGLAGISWGWQGWSRA